MVAWGDSNKSDEVDGRKGKKQNQGRRVQRKEQNKAYPGINSNQIESNPIKFNPEEKDEEKHDGT